MSDSKASLLERYQACLLLHAVGDTLGYKNGDWEFNYGHRVNFNFTLEILYEFIALGGINQISLQDWRISDDTILHHRLGELVAQEWETSPEELLPLWEKELVRLDKAGELKERDPGIATIKAIQDLQQGKTMKDRSYQSSQGGSGVTMRNPVLGLCYPGEKNRERLIEVALVTGLATHKGGVGFLGGIVTALFTAFAVEKKPILEWVPEMLTWLEKPELDELVQKYLGSEYGDEYRKDYGRFLYKWKRYLQEKIEGGPGKRRVIPNPAMSNLVHRFKHYHDQYGYHRASFPNPGGGGDDSNIIAYDALVDAGENWETLVIYSMLHLGDSDTTGCLAGAWYGACYGLGAVPRGNYQYLERKKELLALGEKLAKLVKK